MNCCPCPFLESQVWVKSGADPALRERLLACCGALARAISSAHSPATPLAMVYLPTCKAPYSHSSLSQALVDGTTGSWELYFLCQDSRPMNSEKRSFAHAPLTIPRLPILFKDALPLLKCAVACLMCEKVMGHSAVARLPFNVSGFCQLFDFAALVALANYYDHYAGEALSTLGQSTRGKNTVEKTPLISLDCDELQAALICLESALVCIHSTDLPAASSKTREHLDRVRATWKLDSGFECVAIEKRTWWVSHSAFSHRWGALNELLEDPTARGGIGFTVKTSVQELMTHIAGELGVRDSALAENVALRLTREGFETWNDVIRIQSYFGGGRSNAREEMMKYLVERAGIPFAVAGKIVKYTEENA